MVTTVVLAFVAAVVWRGGRRLRRRAGARAMSSARMAASLAGLTILALAADSPLAELAEASLSAHMIQHALLMIAAPPLLLWGGAGSAIWWALPARVQRDRDVQAVVRRASRVWHGLGRPVVAVILYGVVFWAWHAPALYEWALGHEAAHAAEHASFVTVALLLWSSVMHRRSAVAYGVATFSLFLTALHSGALGALLAVSTRVWYPSYVGSGRYATARALADQQWAGLLMWIPLGIPFIVAGLLTLGLCLTTVRKMISGA